MAGTLSIGTLVLLAVGLTGMGAHAIEWKPNGVELRVTYVEPSARADGTPLTNLAKTTVYYQVPGKGVGKSPDIAATKPTGGGRIETTILVPIVKGEGGYVSFWVTATDESGRESSPSERIERLIDRR